MSRWSAPLNFDTLSSHIPPRLVLYTVESEEGSSCQTVQVQGTSTVQACT